MRPFKVGLDVHGVIDTFPNDFKRLSNALLDAGHEVHIVTGLKYDGHIQEELEKAGIRYSHYFSIVDQLESDGVEIKWENGLPWAPDKPWNEAKSKYCEAVHIDLMIDDSYVYRDTFHDISTVFLHLINKNRKRFKVREDDDVDLLEAQLLKTVTDVEVLLSKHEAENTIEIGASTVRDLIGTIKEQQKFINQVKGK